MIKKKKEKAGCGEGVRGAGLSLEVTAAHYHHFHRLYLQFTNTVRRQFSSCGNLNVAVLVCFQRV